MAWSCARLEVTAEKSNRSEQADFKQQLATPYTYLLEAAWVKAIAAHLPGLTCRVF